MGALVFSKTSRVIEGDTRTVEGSWGYQKYLNLTHVTLEYLALCCFHEDFYLLLLTVRARNVPRIRQPGDICETEEMTASRL